jgi:DNA-binding NarL/FixJ family response regulator
VHRVLIVEPSENVATTLRAVLEEHELAVDVVPHAQDVDLDRVADYAVLIIDVHRENGAAFALLDRVHRSVAHLAGRIVVMSADDSDAIARELDLLGVCGIVPKPVDAEEIVRAVFECLGKEPA